MTPDRAGRHRVAFAPGRVNLIGDHVDYAGGYVLPMAVHLGTTVDATTVATPVDAAGGARLRVRSDDEAGIVTVTLPIGDPASVEPAWGRYVAGVAAELGLGAGADASVRTTLPIGAGLSSSAALEVAAALALGFEGPPLELARLCQRAEQRASGVPCGIMDMLASAAGVEGHLLLIDCTAESVTPVPLPAGAEVVVVHSGEPRALAASAYADRRASVEAAAAVVGPLRAARLPDLDRIDDEVVRRRARHVLTENDRTLATADALRAGDLAAAGARMVESHRSLRDDFEVSTPALDALVDRLVATPGVHGARLTGAGFGGCAVALCEPGALAEGWAVRPVAGAHLV